MPANLVKGQDAVDVAGYIAAVAGTNAKPPAQQATDGKSIFSANCASCHTLKAAFAIVQKQVENGGSVMPAFKGKLTQPQIDAVAKFVAGSAGK